MCATFWAETEFGTILVFEENFLWQALPFAARREYWANHK